MKRIAAFSLLLAICGMPAQAQIIKGAAPGWTLGGDNPQNFQTGTETLKGMPAGKQAAYIKAGSGAACNTSAILYQNISAENYRGKRVRLAARLTGDKIFALQLFIGIIQPTAKIARFYQPVHPAAIGDWKREEAVIDVPADAETMAIGFRMGGPTGTGWIDEVGLDVVGDALPASVQRMWGQTADQINFCRGFPSRTPKLTPSFGSTRNNPLAGQGLGTSRQPWP
jgi:hypothetical protein